MKYFVLEEINKDNALALFEFLNIKGKKTVVIDSDWWSSWYAKLIIRELNKAKDVTVEACNVVSAWFEIFYQCACKKALVDWARWMAHLAAIEWLTVQANKSTTRSHTALVNAMAQMTSPEYTFLTEEERKLYDDWQDVYFDFNRMKEIFPDAEIIY